MTTKKLAVFGNPIAHSKSPIIHQAFGSQLGIPVEYSAILSTQNDFEKDIRDFFDNGADGCNITVPFKQTACLMSDKLTERAEQAGAVNTFFMQDGKLIGDNTDGFGFLTDLKQNFVSLEGKHVLLIGAGGAARGVVWPILKENPASLTIANRTRENAQCLADLFRHKTNDIPIYAKGLTLSGIQHNFDVAINSTAASMTGSVPALESDKLENLEVAYDMYYSQKKTSFNAWMEQRFSTPKTIDGRGMLIEQAAESFFVWTGKKPDTYDLDFLLFGD